MNSPENFDQPPNDFDSREGEHHEAELETKHNLHLELEETSKTKERRAFLSTAFGFKQNAPEKEAQHTREFQDMLREWQNQVASEHAAVLEELATTGNVGEVVNHAWEAQDRGTIDSLQTACKDVLEQYRDRPWQELTEQEKRSIRTAEMSIFMTDLVKVSLDSKQGQVNLDSAQRLVEKMRHYSRSVDLPPTFGNELLRGGAEHLAQDIVRERAASSTRRQTPGQRPPQSPRPSPSMTPWEQGNFSDLWGSPEAGQPPEEPENTIDMVYDPETGAYQSPDEAGKRTPPRTSRPGKLQPPGELPPPVSGEPAPPPPGQ